MANGDLGSRAFRLNRNAFYLLGASLNSSTSEITDLAEDAEFDGEISQEEIQRAKNALLVPNLRLAEEVSYLPGQSKTQIQKVTSDLKSNNNAIIPSEYEHYGDISRLNIFVHSCSDGDFSVNVLACMDLWKSVDEAEFLEEVNEARRSGGIPTVSASQLSEAIVDLRSKHSLSLADQMWREQKPGSIMEFIVERELENGVVSPLLDVLIWDYDQKSEPSLVAIEASIDEQIEIASRRDAGLKEATWKISDLLVEWDDVNQAVQRYEQNRGHEEGRSKRIYHKIRDLALSLANEHGLVEDAKYLSEASLRTFPELETVASDLRADISTLNNLVTDQKTSEALQPLIDAFVKSKPKLGVLGRQIISHGILGNPLKNPLKSLSKELKRVLNQHPDHKLSALRVMQVLAIDLHNEMELTAAALRVLSDVKSQDDKSVGNAAIEFFDGIEADHYSLRVMLSQKKIIAQQGNLPGMEREIRQLLMFAKGQDLVTAKANLADLEAEKERRKKDMLVNLAWWGGGILFLFFIFSS